ncbi:hypothetical protein Tco_0272321, partial [Tanacetum coccineum]
YLDGSTYVRYSAIRADRDYTYEELISHAFHSLNNDHELNAASIIFDTRRDAADVILILLFIDHAKFFHQSISFRPWLEDLVSKPAHLWQLMVRKTAINQTYTSLAIESKFMKRWEFDSIAQAAKGLMSWFPGTLYEALLLEHHLHYMIDVNDCVKTSYNQMESDEPRDENIMDYSDQKELSDEYYTNKFRKVNKEDRREDDKLRRQQCLGEF